MSYILVVDAIGEGSDFTKKRRKNQINSYLDTKQQVLFISYKEVQQCINKYDVHSMVVFGEDALRHLFGHLPLTVTTIYKAQFTEFAFTVNSTTKASSYVIPCFISPSLSFINKQSDGYESALQFLMQRASKAKPYSLDLDCNYIKIRSVPELKKFFNRLKQEEVTAFDIETVGLNPAPMGLTNPILYSISFSFLDGDTFAFPIETYWKPQVQTLIKQALAKWLVELCPDQVKIAHNLKFELQWLLYKCLPTIGLKWQDTREVGVFEDTQLLVWLLNGNKGTMSLKFAAPVYLNVKDWSVDVKDVRRVPIDDLLYYNALDSFYTLRLWQRIKPKVQECEQLLKTYDKVLMPSCHEFTRVEMRGVPYDKNVADKFSKYFESIKTNAMRTIINEVGYGLSPSKNEDLIKYFKNKGYKWSGKTDSGGVAMGEDQINEIKKKYKDPICKPILDYRKATKALSTYIVGPQRYLYKDNTIKASYNLTSTITGRTSSESPNMQNFPKRQGKEIRECFVAPPGYVFASFDYGQIEARLFGVLTGDPIFVKDLFSGVDMHLENAKYVFGEENAKEYRTPMKGGTFASLYGSSVNNLKNTLNISYNAAKKLVDFIFKKYKKFKPWQRNLMKFKDLYGFVEGLTGRRRREPMTYNEALNHPLQSSASDLTLISMSFLNRKYDVIMMIHDDLTFLLKEDTLEEDIELIVESMLVLPWLHIHDSPHKKAWCPLQVEVEIGPNWGKQEFVLKSDSIEIGIDNEEKCIKRAKELAHYFMSL